MGKEHKILGEIKLIFEKSGFRTLSSAIDDFSKQRISESTLEEILFEWNTRINPEYIEEENEGETIRKLIPLRFIKFGEWYIHPGEIHSIKQDTIYDSKDHKKKYLLIINSDEDEKKILYKNLTLAFDSENERCKELNWLKEILSFYGVTFQN